MIRNTRDFYGRKREVAKLYARIGASRPQSVSITGERRIGKSSLLWYITQVESLADNIPDPETIIFVHLDFQENREMQTDDFCGILLDSLKEKFPDISSDKCYDALLKSVQYLDAKGYKLIMLLDEFETVTQNPNFDARFYAFLRSLANRYNVAYVTSSRIQLQQLCHTKQIADSPFFNIFSSLHLGSFSEAEAMELITTPSTSAGIPLEAYADFLLNIGGTYPFFLQIACSALFEHLQSNNELDDFGRKDVCDSILEEALPHFEYIWEKMEEPERQACMKMIEGKPIEPRDRAILRTLIQQGYVMENQGKLKLFSSLFAQFIEEVIPMAETSPKGKYAPEAIVVIDICGSSKIADLYGAHRLQSLYDELEDIAFEVSGRFRDRYRRSTGDGLLITFHTVTDAVKACLEIQRRIYEHNQIAEESHHIPIRFSIHFGETLVDEEERRHGPAVNMAFKVEALSVDRLSESSGYQIPKYDYMLVTEHVARDLASIKDIQYRELGTFELEGFTGLHRIYEIVSIRG
jgi:class 3 adenylate cyclase